MQHVLSVGAFVVTSFSSLGPSDDEVKVIPRTEDRGIRTLQGVSKHSTESRGGEKVLLQGWRLCVSEPARRHLSAEKPADVCGAASSLLV